MKENVFKSGVHKTLPSSQYIDKDIFKVERERILGQSWHLAGHINDVQRKGDYLTEVVDGKPVIVIRSENNEIKAFFNVCPHRGHELVRVNTKGNTHKIVCPYHSWVFDTSGRLKYLPNKSAFHGIEEHDCSLIPLSL
ncbi:Rieske (2Fe-2S) protein [Vibrio sp. Isolate22]|uniref:aromatic ring-hydroxylating oxygenase subunit alpha n=1 Tax=Vibrio sp. Isolate22 TaxID=2908532 RepID=UPI001EFE572A|nr:Rieske (2Fe-2S) protein [Vibrio sp. Isolate22]MCG9695058.1 Rieske (2Fe-2S) protein [Vibrio sp. Isolate22]